MRGGDPCLFHRSHPCLQMGPSHRRAAPYPAVPALAGMPKMEGPHASPPPVAAPARELSAHASATPSRPSRQFQPLEGQSRGERDAEYLADMFRAS